MRQRILRGGRWLFVTVGVIGLTSFTVDATLTGGGMSQSALGILARSVAEEGGGCGPGTSSLALDEKTVCVDTFEASPGNACPHGETNSVADTRNNLDEHSCQPVSTKDAVPWTFVTLGQAQELCARAGKRLLNPELWYRASLGVPDAHDAVTCNVQGSGLAETGAYAACTSGSGVLDMIGNAWEWVDGEVVDGSYEGRVLPDGGYVAEADTNGFVTKTAESPNPDYHEDYFWSSKEGTYGILRGGFYGSGNDAGLYAIQAKTAPSFSGSAIGFRCVSDPR